MAEYTCFSCARPLPEAIATTPRFARPMFATPDDDYTSWGEEAANLLKYLETVFSVMLTSDELGEEDREQFQLLSLDLVQEADRRLQKLQGAAAIWQTRVQKQSAAGGED